MSQLTLWSAGAREPAVTDLDGLLAGPGHIVVRGETARIGVVVDAERAPTLRQLIQSELSIDVEITEITGEAGLAVRTPWLAELRPVAAAWQRGSLTVPPPGWTLDGPRLRWWAIAAGQASSRPPSYSLKLGATNEAAWPAVGAALSAAGAGGAFVGPRAGGPAYRVVGQRRLHRLRELVGDPPAGVAEIQWPPPLAHASPVAP